MKTLKEAAKFEGYLDEASEEIKALEKKLTHNLDRDLDYFSKGYSCSGIATVTVLR